MQWQPANEKSHGILMHVYKETCKFAMSSLKALTLISHWNIKTKGPPDANFAYPVAYYKKKTKQLLVQI